MGKGLDYIADLLNDINQSTIDTAVSTVENIFGIEYDKAKPEQRESRQEIIEVNLICPFENEECIGCRECGDDFED